MCWMWLSAVFAEMNSRSEISRVVAPSAISRSTCVSRAVRPAAPPPCWLAAVERAPGEVDLVDGVGGGVAEIHRAADGGEPRRRLLAELGVEPLAELGERRARGGRSPASLAIAPSRVRATPGRSSRSNRAGRLANVMTSCATAPERTNAPIEVPKRVSAVSSWPSEVCSRAASRARKPSKNRTSCSPSCVDALVPDLQRALRVRLRVGQPDDPQRVDQPVGIADLARRRNAGSGELQRLLDPSGRLQAVDVRGDPVRLPACPAAPRRSRVSST